MKDLSVLHYFSCSVLLLVDLIERLQLAAERRSPKHDMVPRSQVEEAEEELGRRTEVGISISEISNGSHFIAMYILLLNIFPV